MIQKTNNIQGLIKKNIYDDITDSLIIMKTRMSKDAQLNLKFDISERFCINYIGWILFMVSISKGHTVDTEINSLRIRYQYQY